MKPLLPAQPEALRRAGPGQPPRPRPPLLPTAAPTLPVLQRQSTPQQRAFDLRRR